MLISYSHKFIFIHNWKVAGTSVRAALAPYAIDQPTQNKLVNILMDNDSYFGFRLNSFISRSRLTRYTKNLNSFRAFEKHNTADIVKQLLPYSLWHRYYKFGFVRNPWDREVSNYEFIIQNSENPMHETVRSMRGFDQYVEEYVTSRFYLQKWFFFDRDGNNLVDYIGRFENLEEDFEKVCSYLNIKSKLPHKNITVRPSYKRYYSDLSAQIIYDIYKEDVEAFGYEF